MEFEFRRELGGQAQLELSMGHEAIARFINDELGDSHSVKQLLAQLAQGEFSAHKPFTFEGREQTLVILDGEVEVKDHRLHQHEELDDPDLSLYDAESEACCGLDDFEHLLHSWLEFLGGR
ncbi:YacL family protein [Ferrimonas lipolytica]|uniref:YacL family protein n=1 Tax=Ferrimonas lipolytica TaxID=2724191 RepID=A0A6H1UHR3_9GAMM|nr:YacL family protein [Ferrimonas lipolytica]QIZ77853.1 YacL family protein [Ferrimonas lipolytica]